MQRKFVISELHPLYPLQSFLTCEISEPNSKQSKAEAHFMSQVGLLAGKVLTDDSYNDKSCGHSQLDHPYQE
jgi:hypothetical protein